MRADRFVRCGIAVVGGALLGAAAAVACGDVDDPAGAANDAAAAVFLDSAVTDAGAALDGRGLVPACLDERPRTVAEAGARATVERRPGACDGATIARFRDGCLAPGGSQAACDAVAFEAPACASCLFATDATNDDGVPLRPAITVADGVLRPSVEACAALAVGDAACVEAFVAESDCLLGACAACAAGELGGCQTFAAAGPCAASQVPVGSRCGEARANARAAIAAACEGADVPTTFVKVATALCAP